MPDSLLQQIPMYLESAEALLPKIKNPVILTGEYTPMNFLVKPVSGVWYISGLIDFGDAIEKLDRYAKWKELISEHEKSGLLQKEFCKERNIKPSQFGHRLSKKRNYVFIMLLCT